MKKKTAKRILALLLTAVILLSAVPLGAVTAFAADAAHAASSGDFTYEVQSDGTAKITDYVRSDKYKYDVSIPSYINGRKVTIIDFNSWNYDSSNYISKITIPETVTDIPSYYLYSEEEYVNPFINFYELYNIDVDSGNKYYCSENGVLFNKNKTELITYPQGKMDSYESDVEPYVIPYGVKRIIPYAFYNAYYLTDIVIPDTVEYIGNYAFNSCSLNKGISIPESVNYIGDYALSGCRISDVTIPKNVTHLGERVFSNCEYLEKITVDPLNTNYCSEDGVLFNKSKTELIQFPNLLPKRTYSIPKTVKKISAESFERCEYLTTICIPASVAEIGWYAFGDHSFEEKQITDVHYESSESKWNSIAIDEGNSVLLNAEFHYNWDGNDIKLPDFEYEVLYDGTIRVTDYLGTDKEITVPATIDGRNVTVLDVAKWYTPNTYPTKITIPATVNNIPLYDDYIGTNFDPFSHFRSLTEISVSSANRYYNSEDGVLFNKDKTTLISYPKEKADSYYAVPDGVVKILQGFSEYNYTQYLYLPASVRDIDDIDNWNYFGEHLTSITIDPSNTKYKSIDGVLFEKTYNGLDLVRYPSKKPGDTYTIPNGVTGIKAHAFEKLYVNKYINIPASVTKIDFNAFNTYYVNNNGFSTYGGLDFEPGITGIYVDPANSVYSSMDNVLFNKDKTELVYYPCHSNKTYYEIPNGVTKIDNFIYSYNLIWISVPKTVKEIKDYAFCDTYIGGVFYYGSEPEWNSINIGSDNENLTRSNFFYNWDGKGKFTYEILDDGTAETDVFYGSETSITVPSKIDGYTVTSIGWESFRYVDLKEVFIPTSVNYIGYDVFDTCTGLTDVYYAGSEAQWKAINIENEYGGNDNLLNANIHYNWSVDESVIDYGKCGATTQWKLDKNGTLNISGTGIVKNYNKASLVPWNKYASQIKNVVVEDGVTRIGEFAFYGCTNLASVALPDSLKEINGYVFKNCSALTSITLPKKLEKIGDSAFYGTGLTSIKIPATVKSIGYYAFSRCYSLKNIEFTGNAPAFYSNAFNKVAATVIYPTGNATWTAAKKQPYGGTLKWLEKGLVDEGLCGSGTYWKLSKDGTLTLGGTGIVKHYSSPALVPWRKYADMVTKVVVLDGVTRIGEFAFYGCTNLTSVTIADSVKEISGYVFKNCSSLTSITLPKNLTKIGDSAFYGTGLRKITIPATVNYVGWYAFSRCSYLYEVQFLGSAPNLPGKEFNMVTATIYYPAGNSTWNNVAWDKLGGNLKHIAK